jgi:hypothetical protein
LRRVAEKRFAAFARFHREFVGLCAVVVAGCRAALKRYGIL